ncbi:MAG: methylated-DNA--[protein]-cysteine S-methyltransferase [Actinomycetaceae bacterium]|nr:methylated-DNA--[protein]-cysteine S-methyltransferase [Actinomycetaceae bacterium]
MLVRHTLTVTPVGELMLVASDDVLTGVYFEGHHPAPKPSDLGVWVSPADSTLSVAADQIHEFLAGERTGFSLLIDFPKAGFRSRVWEQLMRIPYAEVSTYKALAASLGNPHAYRAVGTAVANNPLSIVVPCHRVIAADGSLSGYAGGVERKRHLLQMEYSVAKRLGLKDDEPDLFSGF